MIPAHSFVDDPSSSECGVRRSVFDGCASAANGAASVPPSALSRKRHGPWRHGDRGCPRNATGPGSALPSQEKLRQSSLAASEIVDPLTLDHVRPGRNDDTERGAMKRLLALSSALTIAFAGSVVGLRVSRAQEQPSNASSYLPVVIKEDFARVVARMKSAKTEVMTRQQALLNSRYDLGNRTVAGVTMTRGKPIQEGIRVKLPSGTTWTQLAQMAPDDIRAKDLFPDGFLPLPHANHPEGGMV